MLLAGYLGLVIIVSGFRAVALLGFTPDASYGDRAMLWITSVAALGFALGAWNWQLWGAYGLSLAYVLAALSQLTRGPSDTAAVYQLAALVLGAATFFILQPIRTHARDVNRSRHLLLAVSTLGFAWGFGLVFGSTDARPAGSDSEAPTAAGVAGDRPGACARSRATRVP